MDWARRGYLLKVIRLDTRMLPAANVHNVARLVCVKLSNSACSAVEMCCNFQPLGTHVVTDGELGLAAGVGSKLIQLGGGAGRVCYHFLCFARQSNVHLGDAGRWLCKALCEQRGFLQ